MGEVIQFPVTHKLMKDTVVEMRNGLIEVYEAAKEAEDAYQAMLQEIAHLQAAYDMCVFEYAEEVGPGNVEPEIARFMTDLEIVYDSKNAKYRIKFKGEPL